MRDCKWKDDQDAKQGATLTNGDDAGNSADAKGDTGGNQAEEHLAQAMGL